MRVRRLLVLGVSTLVVLELALRLGVGLGDPPLAMRDEAVEYRLIPSADYTRFGNQISINRYGMRAPDHAPSKGAAEQRILLIGDSVIYGTHALDQDDTIALQLSRHLNARSDCSNTVMPAAASSWGPVNQAAFLQDVGTLEADIAILLVSGHDLFDTPSSEMSTGPYREHPSFGAIHDAAQIFWERFVSTQSSNTARAPRGVRKKNTLAALTQIHTQLVNDGIPLVLVYHPTTSERVTKSHGAHSIFKDWAQAQNVLFQSLGESLGAADYRDAIHPNASGGTKIAKTFAELIQRSLPIC